MIVAIHGLREYLDLPYQRLLDVLYEMHGIVEKLDLELSELPDFTTVCARNWAANDLQLAQATRHRRVA